MPSYDPQEQKSRPRVWGVARHRPAAESLSHVQTIDGHALSLRLIHRVELRKEWLQVEAPPSGGSGSGETRYGRGIDHLKRAAALARGLPRRAPRSARLGAPSGAPPACRRPLAATLLAALAERLRERSARRDGRAAQRAVQAAEDSVPEERGVAEVGAVAAAAGLRIGRERVRGEGR